MESLIFEIIVLKLWLVSASLQSEQLEVFILCCKLQGYHGDTSETFICGTVDSDVKQFVEVGS